MTRALVVLTLGIAFAACAPKMAPLPPAVAAPRFPEFVQPVAPAGIGTPAALERHEIAWQWLQAGDLRAAERNFNSALKQSPTFYPAEVGLGYVALAGKKNKDALLYFDRAVVGNPRYAPALAGRAEALLAGGEIDEAVASIEAALTADPSLGALRSRLEVLRFRNQQADIANARKLASAGRLEEARTAYVALVSTSPASPFLLRELADVERRAGNIEAALEPARKAVELEPDEVRGHLLLGELYEAQGDVARAADEFATAATLQPDEALTERIATLRSRASFEAMPAEYRSIQESPTVTRAQLAAVLAVRLDSLLLKARRVNAVVITDTRGSWASPHILAASRAGVMEVYPNHTFQPDAIVRRGDLAQAASKVLEIIAAANPQLATAWRSSERRKFPDVGPRHFSYPAVSLVVEAGVMTTRDDGGFDLTQPVSGAEAIAAVTRLQELGGPEGSMNLTAANQLTILRMLLIPAFVIQLLYGHRGWALTTFLVAGLTDLLDGLIARATGQKTTLGAWLDPMADKLLLVTMFIVLTLPGIGANQLPVWFTVLVISRDVAIVLTVAVINLAVGPRTFRPSIFGKVATATYIVTGVVTLYFNYLETRTPIVSAFVWASLVITVVSAFHYLIQVFGLGLRPAAKHPRP